MSLNEFTQVQAPVYCDSILTYPSTWGDGGARSRRKRCVNLNWFLNRRGFVPEHNRGAGLQGAGDIVTHHHTQPDHNRLPHDTGHTRHDSHTHTQINLGDACLATLNAKQAVPSELGSSGERSAPSPGSTQFPTAAKKHYYIQNGCRLKRGIILASVLHALLRRQSGWQ